MRFIILLIFGFLYAQSELSDRYTTYNEIQNQLNLWHSEFSNNVDPYNYPGEEGIIYHHEVIGYSDVDSLPIWAVKLSFNADQNLDKPKVLILGQCHAEEIYGVEISMSLIDRLLNPLNYPSEYQSIYAIMQNTEIWVIPTHNPDGLSVVHGWYEDLNNNNVLDEGEIWNQDVYYRKNKFDANGNGVFDYVVGPGDDEDGVDLNRNYDLNWFFGDGLDVADGGSCNPSYITNFDYYRGTAPFSEPEVRAIRDFALEKNFLLSIAYHSSRSGCVAEKVIYPWEWGGTKPSPDFDITSRLGIEIANLIPKEVEAGSYYPVGSQSRKGNAHDWFYLNTGCIQYLIEVGSENMQPNDVDLIESNIDNNIVGAMWLLKRAAGTNIQNGPDVHQITGIVTDAVSGNPISCEVSIDELNGPMLSPRMTDEFGRYRRLLVEGTYTINFESFGYESQSHTFVPSSGQVTEYNVAMQPLDIYNLNVGFDFPVYFDEPLTVVVEGDRFVDTTLVGLDEFFNSDYFQLNYSLPVGEYRVSIFSENIFPEVHNVALVDSDNVVDLNLKWKSVAVSEEFNSSDNLINNSGWLVAGGMLSTQSDLLYANSRDFAVTMPFNVVDSISNYILSVNSKYELEWGNDYVNYTVSQGGNNEIIHTINDHYWNWHNVYMPFTLMSQEVSPSLNIVFHSDIDLNYRGVQIEDVDVLYKSIYEDCNLGDYNQDGIINVNDIIYIVNIVIECPDEVSGYIKCVSDLNLDQIINVIDIISVINIILENEN